MVSNLGDLGATCKTFAQSKLDGKQGPNLLPFGPGFDATGPQSSKIVEESKKQSQAMHMMLSLGVPFCDSLQSGSFGLELSSLYKTLKAPSRAEFSVCFSDGHCTEIGTEIGT
jgi:hypothetical protein